MNIPPSVFSKRNYFENNGKIINSTENCYSNPTIQNKESNIENIQLLQGQLNNYSLLTSEQIETLIQYVQTNLSLLTAYTSNTQTDLHTRSFTTGLPLPIEITKSGKAFLLFKKMGSDIGEGSFRKVKMGVALSEPHFPLIAHSTCTIQNLQMKNYSDQEILILKKIAKFIEKRPQSKGLLQFYGVVDYKAKSSNERHSKVSLQKNDRYDQELKASFNATEKRSISTKLYNHGNLEDCLETLEQKNKIRVSLFILQGLVLLHSMDIFHSDIKSDNIFLEKDEQGRITNAVLGDLGFACDLSIPQDRFFKNGHHAHRAPEASMLKAMDPIDSRILACDVYSLGLILSLLFSDNSSTKLQDLIQKMISKDPIDRPNAKGAYEAFLKALKAL